MIWLIHIPLISFCLYQLFQHAERLVSRRVVVLMFLVKIAVVLCASWYNMYVIQGDSLAYLSDLIKLNEVFEESPDLYLNVLYNKSGISEGESLLIFQGDPRPFFLLQILSPFFLVVRNYWLMCFYLGLLVMCSFLHLLKALNGLDKKLLRPAIIALFFYPSTVFWSSGLMKEPLALSCITLLITLALSKKITIVKGMFFLILSFVLYELKYFYAGTLIPILFTYKFSEKFSTNNKYVVSFSLLVVLYVAATFIHPVLHIDSIVHSIHQNYSSMASAGRLDVVYEFDGSFSTVLLQLPQALFVAMFRPMFFIDKIEGGWYAMSMLENTVLLVLIIFVACKCALKKIQFNLLGVLSLIYVILGLSLVSIACSNFGTLSRYKAGYLFVLIILCLRIVDVKWSIGKDFFYTKKSKL